MTTHEPRIPAALAQLRALASDLRSRTWLAPMSAAEMNHRDRWLADQIDAVLAALGEPESTVQGCVIGEYCRAHGFIHGAEAEELRERFERLLELYTGKVPRREIRSALDDVDARDSCAFVEHKPSALGEPPAPPVPQWQPIETLPSKEIEVFFRVVSKTPEESGCDTSGDPIFGTHAPYLHRGKHGTWSSLDKATHWHPMLILPVDSVGDATPPAQEK